MKALQASVFRQGSLTLTALVVLLLATIALWILPPQKKPLPIYDTKVPSVWVILSLGLVSGFLWQAVLILTRSFFPVLAQGALVLIPLLVALALAILIFWLFFQWVQARGWGDLHILALCSGALVAHTLFGVLFLTFTPLDKIGLAVMGIVMICLLLLLTIHIRRREHIQGDLEDATTTTGITP